MKLLKILNQILNENKYNPNDYGGLPFLGKRV